MKQQLGAKNSFDYGVQHGRIIVSKRGLEIPL